MTGIVATAFDSSSVVVSGFPPVVGIDVLCVFLVSFWVLSALDVSVFPFFGRGI